MRPCVSSVTRSVEWVRDPGENQLAALYDDWAGEYEATHADWEATVRRHGELLAEALADRGIEPPARVLDCTCGTGAQAIGLALAGYSVTGTDLSAGEIDYARSAAETFGVSIDFAVADLLDPSARSIGYDAVLTANSLTHFGGRQMLEQVLATVAALARPGGLVVVTNRDYDDPAVLETTATPAQKSVRAGVRRVSLQLWDWNDTGESYRMESLLLTAPVPTAPASMAIDGQVVWNVRSRTTTLRAWRRADIERAAASAGLVDIHWTETSWQPIMSAVRPR